jgi:hypothetical protein
MDQSDQCCGRGCNHHQSPVGEVLVLVEIGSYGGIIGLPIRGKGGERTWGDRSVLTVPRWLREVLYQKVSEPTEENPLEDPQPGRW